MIGRTVGRFRIVAKLGEGGMGSVWKAEDSLLGRTIALKFLPEALASQPEARRRFLREAQAASVLEHPGVATVFDAGEAEGLVYIALQLVDGETLSDVITRGPLPVPEAIHIARAAAEALAHAHDRGVLHRDVSARNIMLARDGRVVVVDFGLALPAGRTRLTESGTAMGTVAYMAPEVAEGSTADRRSDLYGLGVVLYEMLTGTLPFTGERPEAVLYATVHEPPEAPSRRREGVTPGLDRVVLRSLAKDPAQRYQSAGEFAADLVESTAGITDSVTVPVSRSRTSTPRRPSRRALLSGAGLVVLLGILISVFPKLRPLFDPTPGRKAPVTHRIAVLPLHNDSENPHTSDYLADGISQTLITKLTQVSGLQVIPWVTARRYADLSKPLPEIAKDLQVDALLIGTIERDSLRIHGTLSLVDATTGMQSWADEFEEPVADLFALQRRIAVGAATKLKGKLTGQEEQSLSRPASSSVQAYEFYLEGSRRTQEGTPDAEEQAVALFDKALQLDPNLAEAYVGIGAVNTGRYFSGGGGRKDLEAAHAAFERALEIDPGQYAARRGLIKYYWEIGQTEECLKQGQEIAKLGGEDVEALNVRSQAYCFGALADRAVPLWERILELDPANEEARWFLVIANAWAGLYRETIAAGESYSQHFGDDAELHTWVGTAYQNLGDLDRAQSHYEKAIELFGDYSNIYVFHDAGTLFERRGQFEKARQILLRGIEEAKSKLDLHPDNARLRGQLAMLYAEIGDREAVEKEERRIMKEALVNPLSLDQLGRAHVALGDTSQATKLLGEALRSGFLRPGVASMDGIWGHGLLKSNAYSGIRAECARDKARLRSLY